MQFISPSLLLLLLTLFSPRTLSDTHDGEIEPFEISYSLPYQAMEGLRPVCRNSGVPAVLFNRGGYGNTYRLCVENLPAAYPSLNCRCTPKRKLVCRPPRRSVFDRLIPKSWRQYTDQKFCIRNCFCPPELYPEGEDNNVEIRGRKRKALVGALGRGWKRVTGRTRDTGLMGGRYSDDPYYCGEQCPENLDWTIASASRTWDGGVRRRDEVEQGKMEERGMVEEGVSCYCNGSYVSHRCCSASGGMVWEEL